MRFYLNLVLAAIFTFLAVGNFSGCKKKLSPLVKVHPPFGRASFVIDDNLTLKDPALEVMRLTHVTVKSPRLVDAIGPTQKAWLRPSDLERAHLIEGFQSVRPELLSEFAKLGMVSMVTPSRHEYEYIIVLGATYEIFLRRLIFLKDMLSTSNIKFKKLILLGSHRPLERYLEIEPFLKNHPKASLPLTEIEMMELLVEHSALGKSLENVEIIKVASPMKQNTQGKIVRAITRDTVEDMLKQNLEPGASLVISSQPYILRQDLIVRSLALPPWQIETVGPEAPASLQTNVYLDE